MSKLLAVPVVVLACLAVAAATGQGRVRDRDHDGLPDRWEKRYHLSTKKKSGKGDPDSDRLRNRREYKLRLNPRKADSDGDGLRDRAEIRRHKTSPRRRDSDGDGYSDRREIREGTDPNDPNSHPGGGSGGPAPAPSPSPSPSPGPNPPGAPPNPSTTGVPNGWQPAQTRSSSLTVSTPGAVVENILFTGNASLDIRANNVTVRNVKFSGSGQIIGDNGTNPNCSTGVLIENVSFEYPGGYDPSGTPVIQWIGATVRHVEVQPGRSEGIFVGGKDQGCGPMTIEHTLIKIADGRDCDLHADGIQGYGGDAVIIRNVVADSSLANCGTAPFFYPHSQGNTSADIDGLLVIGGTYSFRLGMPGKVRNLRIGDAPPGPYGSGHSWAYGPIDVRCSAVSEWSANIVNYDANYNTTGVVRSQPCNSNGGG
jgi:Bacterial TSP3 repeat